MSQNPYAAPLSDTPVLAKPMMEGGLYRSGDLLVMDKRAQLPPQICIKSNTKAAGTLKRNLSWHHPAVFLALLANILIYAILAVVMSKKATIHIGLSEEWFAKRRFRIAMAWGLVVLSIGALFIGFVMAEGPDPGIYGFLILFGFLGIIGSAIFGLLAARLVSPKKITDTLVILRGVHPDFLARLPHYPHQF